MARKLAVWGIDVGQFAFKALRCTLDGSGNVVADKFDFIEYPKILSSADADPEELVKDALKQFLARNNIVGDKVAISVSGQSGLSRFFKPPPVEVKTLPDIVKYEVKQQIPFPIDEVIWDWQQLGGTVVEGRAIDAEVGLFAMKREAVYRAIRPLTDAEIDVDVVQLAPLALFNYVCHDVIDKLPNPEEFDPDNPPPSHVVMAIGTDTTDLVVTNGIRLWLRSIPIGGNHFTRQLSRELKLTQAKAEHLKRNARQSENPKAVFKAMRPVFNDLVNEVQRSLTFFQSMDKTAQISEIILLGNAAKLPGLRQFLNTQLEIDISKSDSFKRLEGADITKQPAFVDNLLSFAPCYGLCIQGLQKGLLKTNLLPTEIVVERVIEAKKPWVLASVGALMLGLVLGLFFKANNMNLVSPTYKDANNTDWMTAFQRVSAEDSKSKSFKSTDENLKNLLSSFKVIGGELSSAAEAKSTWIDIYSALYQALPKDPRIQALIATAGMSAAADPKEIPFEDRQELYIDHIDSVFFQNLGTWFNPELKAVYDSQKSRTIEDLSVAPTAAPAEAPATDATAATNPLEGKAGWVIEIRGHHFHNSQKQIQNYMSDVSFLNKTFIQNLLTKEDVKLPVPGDPNATFSYADIGIYFPTITYMSTPVAKEIIYDQLPPASTNSSTDSSGSGGAAVPGNNQSGRPEQGNENAPNSGDPAGSEIENDGTVFKVMEFNFVVQMAWIPQSPGDRLNARTARLEARKAAEEAAQAAAAAAAPADGAAAADTPQQ
jgi:type IV pilus assembly protein PilM